MMRDNRSRPKPSVPSRYSALDGFSRCAGNSSTGSCGASHGARIAIATISARQTVATAMIGVAVRKPKPVRNGRVIGIDGSGRVSIAISI
jgi:hypothetical protein